MATSDGLHIRWRETAPEQGLLTCALSELDVLHDSWPDTVQCNIIIERAPTASAEQVRYCAHVEVKLGRRAPTLKAKAVGDDGYAALRRAFGDLRYCMPLAANAGWSQQVLGRASEQSPRSTRPALNSQVVAA